MVRPANIVHVVRRSMSGVQWNESEILMDKKSKFQGRCYAIKHQSEVDKLLEELVNDNKSIQKATHKHMYAWRTADLKISGVNGKIKNKKNSSTNNPVLTNIQQGSNDCGESGAGQRLLTLLERSHICNILVVVTRWYGGTALGPARFRHISSVAVESLKKGNFLP